MKSNVHMYISSGLLNLLLISNDWQTKIDTNCNSSKFSSSKLCFKCKMNYNVQTAYFKLYSQTSIKILAQITRYIKM